MNVSGQGTVTHSNKDDVYTQHLPITGGDEFFGSPNALYQFQVIKNERYIGCVVGSV